MTIREGGESHQEVGCPLMALPDPSSSTPTELLGIVLSSADR